MVDKVSVDELMNELFGQSMPSAADPANVPSTMYDVGCLLMFSSCALQGVRLTMAITSTAIRMLFFLMFFILLKTFVYRSVGLFVCVCIIHNKGVK